MGTAVGGSPCAPRPWTSPVGSLFPTDRAGELAERVELAESGDMEERGAHDEPGDVVRPVPRREGGPGLAFALAFGGGVLIGAAVLRHWTGADERVPLEWSARGLLVGVVASAPTLLLLVWLLRTRLPAVRRLDRLVEEILAPLVRRGGVVGVVVISILAGLGEELLFRGWLQVELDRWGLGVWPALLLASAVFGALHWITAWYALLAGLIGAYYGVLLWTTGDLLVPATAHFVHDLVALGLLLRRSRPA